MQSAFWKLLAYHFDDFRLFIFAMKLLPEDFRRGIRC